eukprot:TRINITY_DN68072_c5_g1_i3.p1 TRINITY_DN68072_c5_g1~~TRINITY_DN68072_c5_g1_i3.p1  ORF type:complete len:165 (+),score=1.31 TRINITY_DN68072_c5_g1_i3:41-535(+)
MSSVHTLTDLPVDVIGAVIDFLDETNCSVFSRVNSFLWENFKLRQVYIKKPSVKDLNKFIECRVRTLHIKEHWTSTTFAILKNATELHTLEVDFAFNRLSTWQSRDLAEIRNIPNIGRLTLDLSFNSLDDTTLSHLFPPAKTLTFLKLILRANISSIQHGMAAG